MNRIKRLIACVSAAAVIGVSSGMCAVTASADWHKNSDGDYYYTLDDGDKLTGWQVIDSHKYYFNKDGYAVTGFKKIKGNTYYFSPDKRGRMATGFKKIDGNIYYFGSDGCMRTGWKKINDKTYYFNSAGKAATGKVKISGKKYTFSKNGVLQSSSPSDNNTSAKSSKNAFAKNAFGNSSMGDSLEEVLADNSLGTYVRSDLSNGCYAVIFIQKGYLGSDAEDILVSFVFDTNDKLLAVWGIDSTGTSASEFKKYGKSKYGDAALDNENGTLYMDPELKYAIVITETDGMVVIMEVAVDDLEMLSDAFSEMS